jgi:hypothetical protein
MACLMADDGQAGQTAPRGHRDGQTDPSGPGSECPGPGKYGSEGTLHHDHLNREFPGNPSQSEADHGQRFPPEREEGVDHEDGTDQADGHEHPGHHSIKALRHEAPWND